MNTHILTGRTKVVDGISYTEVIDTDITGRASAQWTRTSNITMTLSEADRIIAEADLEQLESDLKEEVESEFANDEENQEAIAAIRMQIAELKAKLA